MAKYKAYPEYKDSGVIFLDNPPSHWHTMKIKHLLKLKNEIVGNNHTNFTLLSLTLNGVITRDISSGEGKIPESFATYQRVERNDLIFCLFDMDETPRTVGLSSQSGMITGAYNVYDCNNKADPSFIYYYFLYIDSFKRLKPYYTGLRKVVRSETFNSLKLHLPSIKEQLKIAIYLGYQITSIDNLIEKQLQFIELLKEKRQALISHAVTKGLNPDVPMKDSGVEWLGYMPSHWHVSKIKWIICLKSGESITSNEIASDGNYPVYGGNGLRGFYKEYTHDGNYVIIGRQGAHCGNVQYANNKFWASEHAIVATPTFKYKIAWLGELFRAMNLNQYSVSAAQPGLSVENISDLKIPLPPYPEQKKLAKYIENHISINDKLIKNCLNCIKLLKERRTALISAAVTGKIDLRDWTPPASSTEASLTTEEATA